MSPRARSRSTFATDTSTRGRPRRCPFECVPQPRLYPLLNQRPFELRHRSDDLEPEATCKSRQSRWSRKLMPHTASRFYHLMHNGYREIITYQVAPADRTVQAAKSCPADRGGSRRTEAAS